MKKLILILLLISLLLIGNVLMYFIIKAYYRSNNIRFPYQNWYLSFKKDVTFREKFKFVVYSVNPTLIKYNSPTIASWVLILETFFSIFNIFIKIMNL